MPKHTRRFKEALSKVPAEPVSDLDTALNLVKECATAKFDETIEMAAKLGVNPRKAEEMVRTTVVLPHGVGKTVRVLVFAEGDAARDAENAGADFVGADDLITKIQQENWLDFDVAIATPNMMGRLKNLGRVLGPRGLMPNPKAGTLTTDVARAVEEAKAGKIEFRTDRTANVHVPVGKASFDVPKLHDNVVAFLQALLKAKPASAKGTYIRSLTLSSTMGPAIRLDVPAIVNQVKA
ncbi:MAG: 50S ribosomal protein L1 [Gemmatimonadetes bacterium]|nr:MAG: 50S ribosomal protein L1 [Gemmatimonadota bacterium]